MTMQSFCPGKAPRERPRLMERITQWIEQYATAGLYLTLGVMATGMLVVVWVTSARTRSTWPARATAWWGSLACGSWAGLAARNEWEIGAMRSLGVAAAVAVVVLLLTMALPALVRWMKAKRRQQRFVAAAGQEGVVYRTVDRVGDGLVEITYPAGPCRFPARCETGVLPAFTPVRVERVGDDGVLRVSAKK